MQALQAICEIHGPMVHRQDEHAWVCLGWDGEGCGIPVSDEAVTRVGNGITRWPGIKVEASIQ